MGKNLVVERGTIGCWLDIFVVNHDTYVERNEGLDSGLLFFFSNLWQAGMHSTTSVPKRM